MKYIVLGGVAAGTKTAAKLKREDINNEVTIYTKEKEISYAGCGLPYYIGGAIEAVIMRACNKNPAQRFAHAGEFLHALERIKTPDDPPSVLANYRSEPTINLTDNGEKTRISMPAVQQTSAQRPATPTKSQAIILFIFPNQSI